MNLDQILDAVWKEVIPIFRHILAIRVGKEIKSWVCTEV